MSMNQDANGRELTQRPAPPLPATREEMEALRKTKNNRTLNDMVEEVHLALYEDERYQGLINAVWHSEAIEGSTQADDCGAAEMIRKEAKRRGNTTLASKNWATIIKAHKVVLDKYGLSRAARRRQVSGQEVPRPSGDDDAA